MSQQEISILNEKLNTETARRVELEKQIENLNMKHMNIVASYETKIAKLHGRVDSAKEETSQVQAQVEQLTIQVKERESQLESEKKVIEELKKVVSDTQHDLEAKRNGTKFQKLRKNPEY